MHERRIKIFILICIIPLAAALARLAELQIFDSGKYIAKLNQIESSKTRQLKTVRGKILDRNGVVVASNEARFSLCVSYNLTRLADERFWQAEMIKTFGQNKNMESLLKSLEYDRRRASLARFIQKCMLFYGLGTEDMDIRLAQINDYIWKQRSFVAWYRNCTDSKLRLEKGVSVDWASAMVDFAVQVPDESKRLVMIGEVTDLAEMYRKWPLIELDSDDGIFAAQMEFTDVNDFEVMPGEVRVYPYGSTASQLVGWVGMPQDRDIRLFSDDKRASYRENELCGHSGIEYICEPILRGRRGEERYTFDRKQVIDSSQTEPGRDITLTIDIELQKNIEEMLTNPTVNDNSGSPMAAVIIDVPASEVLSMVSLPTFRPADIRKQYGQLLKSDVSPLHNRAMNSLYPPGSVIKPVIGIAAMEEGVIRPDEVISCPSRTLSPPNCWRIRDFGVGHDEQWNNCARNAIKGSCNIYFSRVAERLSSAGLQKWLLKFGYGTGVVNQCCYVWDGNSQLVETRSFEQAPGNIASAAIRTEPNTIGPVIDNEKRFFGIGQGSLRVTPLQVASAMAALARGGIYRSPQMIRTGRNDSYDGQAIDISPRTLATIRDGMHAVTSESSGTAYEQMSIGDFEQYGVKLFGKTGSTENPEHAWFAGFAEDANGRSIAFAVLVEGGKRGSKDAAPLARKIVELCIQAGYIGINN
ncbi:MAG: hypothetical protein A2Y12_19655 [Planctomycetes bacterium GWF2_42_9]|nr:MAG: hypothetical protein A2Y12_19655 [Planctomycetes bacterium GWF2_42_9]